MKDPVEAITEMIVLIENGTVPGSINRKMVMEHGLWNLGHLMFAGQKGAVAVHYGRDWAGWGSMEESIEGIRRDVRAKARRGMTLSEIITQYAPPTENNTASYISTIVSATGLDPNQSIKI